MLNVILARHAETIWNEQMRYIGRTDLSLSELGESNAHLLACHLKDVPINEIFSSDMKRAIQTAQAVAANDGSTVKRQPRLKEIDFGAWEGLTHDEIVGCFPDLAEKWSSNPYSMNIPDGEAWPVFTKRVLSGWHETIKQATPASSGGEKTLLIVTHAGCIKIILAEILGISKERAWLIYQDKGSLNYLTVGDQGVKIQNINNTDYRKEAAGTAVVADDRIRPCSAENTAEIHFVINKAAAAYSGFLGTDFSVNEYMSKGKLERELEKMTFYSVIRGGIMIAVMAYQSFDNIALIRHAYVLPACSRQGLAGRLLDYIEKLARRDGKTKLFVGTYKDNSEAISFYKKHGYRLTEPADDAFDEYWDIPRDQALISVILSKEYN